MSFEITGKLVQKYDTQQVSGSFKKREFVIEKKESVNGSEFTDFIKFQLTQDRCKLLDNISTNSDIKISFNIRGRKWEKDGTVNYFTNLEAWKIESNSVSEAENNAQQNDSYEGVDLMPDFDNDDTDLPF